MEEEDGLTDDMFKRRKGAVFGERGVTPEVADGAFFRYEQGDEIPPEQLLVGEPFQEHLGNGLPERPEREALPLKELAAAESRANQRARRASGLMMRRFPVPEADQFLFAEQRPDWPIWSGKHPRVGTHKRMGRSARVKHEGRKKNETTPEQVDRALTPNELARFQRRTGWDVNRGADHLGKSTDEPHLHVKVSKYLFPANQKEKAAFEHDHTKMTPKRLRRHLWEAHEWPEIRYTDSKREPSDPRSREILEWIREHGFKGKHVDESGLPESGVTHEHVTEIDRHLYARRLSSHPMGRERIAGSDVVCFAMEGQLKEAALVSSGYATFSCPSVTLWNAPELDEFVHNHLVGKIVLVIPDSDAWENDQVIAQALHAKTRLDALGARAEIAIPWAEGMSLSDQGVTRHDDGSVTPGIEDANGYRPFFCELHGKDFLEKRGVDDYLADGGKLEDMEWVTRKPGKDLATWIDENDVRSRSGKRLRTDRVELNAVILNEIALHADSEGRYRSANNSTAVYVRPQLERLKGRPFASHASAVTDVSRGIHWLDEYGALSGAETLPDRELQMDYDEWPGELEVHPDLRAQDERRSVGDLLDQ
jgi:hypothetical protein